MLKIQNLVFLNYWSNMQKKVMKEKTCFKNQNRSICIDLFLTNSGDSFQNAVTFSAGLSDFQKIYFNSIKILIYEVES